MTVAAVVLAAGPGSRFHGETHKLLAPLRGRRVVDWAVDHASCLDDLIVVSGAVELGIDGAVHNERWAEGGLASSLHIALQEADRRGHDAVVVAHGDQPGIPPSAWLAVAASIDKPIAQARYASDGRVGHPVRLAREVWALVPKLGEEGAGPVIRERRHLVAEVACEGDPTDVDTLEDLHRWS